MKKSVIFNSVSGNTKAVAEAIKEAVGAEYCGAPDDSTLDSDILYVGFWAKGFSCGDDIADFLKKCNGKKIFLFGTVGYDSTSEYYNKILTAVKEHIDASNTVVGEFLCQGKVSDAKQNAIKEMDEAKFNGMKAKIDEAASHPDAADLAAVKKAVSA